MSDWALGGLVLAMFIAGFNIGQDCKFQRGIFGRKKKYQYFISCFYIIDGRGGPGGYVFNFNQPLTAEKIIEFEEEQRKVLKEKYKTENIYFSVINFKLIKD